jgi:GMP synthase (glutamine-hydrolysing)
MILVINNTMDYRNSMYFPHLIRYLKSLKGFRYKVISSYDELQKVKENLVTHIIISGSPLMVTKESYVPNLDQFILNVISILRYNVPVLGICFGCQLLNVMFGGKLKRLRKQFCEDAMMIRKGSDGQPVRFCLNYVINTPPSSFEVLARANIRNHQVPCIIKHKDRPIYGCLFHPEFHEHTHQLISSFVNNKKI